MIWICRKNTGGCGFVGTNTKFEVKGANGPEISCPECNQDHAELLNVLDFDDQTQGLTPKQLQHAKELLDTKLFASTPHRRNSWFSSNNS